jgi:serine/threonine-protein kinase
MCPKDGTVLETPPPADPNLGRVLASKYRLDRRLGVGGMGTVYEGRHLMLDKAVAIKLIKPEHASTPDITRRFQREARAASSLNHPNIAVAYDLGQTDDGLLYIVMEFISGPSLKDVIKADGPIDPGRIVRILGQVASALALAHKQGIIHRDLKPQNVMIAADEHGLEVAKLVDFGIAKTFDEANTLTSTGFALGTPQYMSPEQAMGKPVDGRSDIYALGIILYEMLVGEVPFSDPSTPAVLVKQLTEVPERPSLRRPDLAISPALEAVALRCLEKDPSARFQSAEAFADAIAAASVSSSSADGTATVVLAPVAAALPD